MSGVVVLRPSGGAPEHAVPEAAWARAVDVAEDAGKISAWFAGRLRDPREIDLLPFDSARMADALVDDADPDVAALGAFLAGSRTIVTCRPATAAVAVEQAIEVVEHVEAAPPAAPPGLPVPLPVAATADGAQAEALPVERPPASRWRRALGPFFGILLIGAKLATKLKVLLLLVGKGKLATTALTSIVSIGAYSLLWGWRFAALFVLLLIVHELGHVVVARSEGVPISAPMLIPFMGALVTMREAPKDAWSEAKIALGGPILGSLGAAAVLGVAELQDSNLLRAAAYTGFFLNLFNLLPITPLDGGRAASALHPAVWGLGAAGLVALIAVFPSPLIILIAFIGLMDAWKRFAAFRSGGDEARRYYAVRPWQRVVVGAVYFGLVAALVVGMGSSHVVV